MIAEPSTVADKVVFPQAIAAESGVKDEADASGKTIDTPLLLIKATSREFVAISITALSKFAIGAAKVVRSGSKFYGLNTPKYANAPIAKSTTRIAQP